MVTKIVYCIVSSESDIYLEQAWVSIYTLRRYNPDAVVVLLVDKGTEATLTGKRAGIRELVSEVIAVDTPDGYNAMQRSRYLKTNFRQIVDGDLLFIDSDTVIGGSLAAIDSIDAEIACVADANRRFSELPERNFIKRRLSSIFGITEPDSEFYFNSGVIYVKDTPKMHNFFADWHEKWKYSAFECDSSFDQPALYAADRENGFIIKELPGEFNCQIAYSLKYFYGGIILHFFNSTFFLTSSEISVFYDNGFYRKLKEYGAVVKDVKEVLDNKSNWFNIQTNIIERSRHEFLCNYVVENIYKSYKENTFLFRFNKQLHTNMIRMGNLARRLKRMLGIKSK